MAEKKNEYWKKRQELKYLAGEKKINDYYAGLKKSFELAKRDIEYIINGFTIRYSILNNMSYADAMQKLTRSEIGELQDFIDKANENMGKYNLELENMSVKARITRYEAMLKQIDSQLQQLYAIEYQYKGEELLKEIYSDAYYQTWFNIDQYHGFHQEFAQISAQAVNELITYPFNGADFSSRLWKQKDYMLQQLNESITTMMIQGRNPKTLVKEFSKKFETKEYEAYRLLHTEGSFIMEQASQAAYKEDSVEKYQWLATLDIKPCEECQPLDGKVFDVGKGVVGINLTPKHCFCRCTTVPYYVDQDLSEETRVARGPVTGQRINVPADMTYEQWHKKYIEGNPEAELAEKKWKNRYADQKQYDKYKIIYKNDIPNNLDDFQKLKYNNTDKWNKLKEQKQDRLNQMDFTDMSGLIGKLGDVETRLWYIAHDEKIPTLLDVSASLENQARKASNLRNIYRTQARDLMADQTKRKQLDIDKPNKTFDELIDDKMIRKSITREEAIKDILNTAQKTNMVVNKSLGLE